MACIQATSMYLTVLDTIFKWYTIVSVHLFVTSTNLSACIEYLEVRRSPLCLYVRISVDKDFTLVK